MKKTVGNLRSSHGFSIHFYGLLAVLTIISGVNGFCAELAAQEQPQEKSAEQQFKNIKVFQGLPVSQLLPAMTYMEAALGVQCSYCHVGRDFDKDDKEQKDSARKMITMVRDINQTNFGGRNEVTCNTCHHGQAHPASLPTVVEITGKAPSPQPRMEQKSTEPLPSAAQILEKYVQALGGKNALDKIETRVMRGTRVTSDGSSAPFEVYQKAPNKMLAIYKFGSAFSIGFDGTNGWSQSDQGIRELDGAHLSRLKQEADFSSSLNLREKYQNLRVIGKLPVGDHQAYVVQGNLSADKRLERLFFDTESGLLLRIFFRETTPLGPLPEETDFDDYRDVNGIKLPFSVLHLGSDRSYKDVCSEILQNTPVDDARFGRPVDSPK